MGKKRFRYIHCDVSSLKCVSLIFILGRIWVGLIEVECITCGNLRNCGLLLIYLLGVLAVV